MGLTHFDPNRKFVPLRIDIFGIKRNKKVSPNKYLRETCWFKNPVSSQTEKLMAGTKFSDHLGLNDYKKAKKLKHFIHLRLTNRPQSFGS